MTARWLSTVGCTVLGIVLSSFSQAALAQDDGKKNHPPIPFCLAPATLQAATIFQAHMPPQN
jgi:hypothetical protein